MADLFLDTFGGGGLLTAHVSDSGHAWQSGSADTDLVAVNSAAALTPIAQGLDDALFSLTVLVPNARCHVEIAALFPVITDNVNTLQADFLIGLWGQWNLGYSVVNGAHPSAIGGLPTLCITSPSGFYAATNVSGGGATIRFDIADNFAVACYIDEDLFPSATGVLTPADTSVQPEFLQSTGAGAPLQSLLVIDSLRVYDDVPTAQPPFWSAFQRSYEVP